MPVETKTESNFNALTLKALLLDTITHARTGMHLDKHYITAKKTLCKLSGQPNGIHDKQLLNLIGMVYRDNNKEAEFWATIDKFDAAKYL